MNEEEKKPTGYHIEVTPEVLAVFMALFGDTCDGDRMRAYGHNSGVDKAASRLWNICDTALERDGYKTGGGVIWRVDSDD